MSGTATVMFTDVESSTDITTRKWVSTRSSSSQASARVK